MCRLLCQPSDPWESWLYFKEDRWPPYVIATLTIGPKAYLDAIPSSRLPSLRKLTIQSELHSPMQSSTENPGISCRCA